MLFHLNYLVNVGIVQLIQIRILTYLIIMVSCICPF